MAGFKRAARLECWTQGEIAKVLDECKTGDYNHLVQTLLKYTD